jgi:hypothetical protein
MEHIYIFKKPCVYGVETRQKETRVGTKEVPISGLLQSGH